MSDDDEASDDDWHASEVSRERDDSGRRLWDSNEVYPMGVLKWSDAINCQAALTYQCPCGSQCLANAGGVIDIYEHRRRVRAIAEAKNAGGMRDTVRRLLSEHYDSRLHQFTKSFVVGKCAHACERAFAVGTGLSEVTFARARADVVQERGWHSDRVQLKHRVEGSARRELDAWIRLQRETMEGDKISGTKWYTEKTTERQLWARYTASCDRAKQPTSGSSRLLFTLWREHTEIKMKPPTGHAICTRCGAFASERKQLQGTTNGDARTRELLKRLDEKVAAHTLFHVTERHYYDDAVARATHVPTDVTTITIDAPTRHQFDLPSQARARRDTVKRLDGSSRWQSKLEGVLDAGVWHPHISPSEDTHEGLHILMQTCLRFGAGVGMYIFLAREALGGGPNLVCTVLLLSLRAHINVGRPLGAKLHLQLDNTTAENKNNTVLGLVALLVAWGVFREASIFFMTVGHTYNELDAAFAPLIDALLSNVVPTISALLEFVPLALSTKRVRLVKNLDHLWDFTLYLKQHMHEGIGGFTVTQQSSGMHEFYLSRNAAGDVRMTCRQSSQAANWFPDGEGDPIFRTVPDPSDAPPVAQICSDIAWERASVAVNVRRWLPFLGLGHEELNQAILDWERVFESLPPDGDISRLRDDQRLQWVAFEPHAEVLGRSLLAGLLQPYASFTSCCGSLLCVLTTHSHATSR